MIRKIHLGALFLFLAATLPAQPERWQQRVEYAMEIDFDVQTHRFDGSQRLVYTNHSPDRLDRVFYHLYLNAFQPGSMMDVRSRTIADPDPRVRDRISRLDEEEMGYLRVQSLRQDGQEVAFEVVGTILEVELAHPIEPNSSTVLEMTFNAQVPIQIRRNGRDNAEGIAYSMAQWYPKLCEYDYRGWHAHPYVGREFYGVWGDFDVRITIDSDYIIGATGYLQNAEEIGYGYAEEEPEDRPRGEKQTWHFVAPDVHDFVWAADPDYTHDTYVREDGVVMHFFYQKNENTADSWAMLPGIMDRAFSFINKRFGVYPYRQYSFIQGGDGGMEYPMATLITGERSLSSLVGVSVHELMHSWYQMILGSNESYYAWMDEGFTSYATNEVMNFLRQEKLIPGKPKEDPQANSYAGYFALVESGLEEPMTTHSDHYMTNFAYGRAAYSKGAVFLHQLEYIIGKEVFAQGMLEYFETWKFKHPNDNDFIRIMEKISGLELDWYREYWVNTIHTIDYGIETVGPLEAGSTRLLLSKEGYMPMPLDLLVTYTDGRTEWVNIPLRVMRGHKKPPVGEEEYRIAADWPWTHPVYELILPVPFQNMARVEIDPSRQMADTDRSNNVFERK